ncbi:MAG: hypothetical protein IJ128_07730 [Firmicutes bacterium]|nr:hypothetical protein [Bacillota bacterium]
MITDQIKLRKYEHILAISGTGVIAFSLWSIVKAVIYVILSPLSTFSEIMDPKELEQLQTIGIGERAADISIIGVILLMMILDVLLRIYIGRSAIADGRQGKKKTPVYLVLSILVAAGMIASNINRVQGYFQSDTEPVAESIRTMTVSWIVDLTSLLALIELIIAGIMVRRLRKGMD